MEYYTSKIGMWYCVWWDSPERDPKYYEWHWVKETRVKPVKFGYYSTDDPVKLEDDFTYFNKIGVDFLILDDTNGHFSDESNTAAHIEACFKMASELGAENAPELCFAGGGPLLSGNTSAMKDELSLFYNYATKKYKENYGYEDDRFQIRLSSGHVTESLPVQDQYNIKKNGLWGWVFDMQYKGSKVMGVNPGWSRSHNNLHAGSPEKSRESGDKYISMWLEAIKANPKAIVIASWNDHAEETGIEAVELLEPIKGRENEANDPYLYQKITEGYLALRTGYLENWYYRAESDSVVYKYTNGKLKKVDKATLNDVILLVPDDYFEWSGVEIS